MELEDAHRAHQQAVFAYFLRLVGNRHDAEELTQETFVRACGAAVRFRGDAKGHDVALRDRPDMGGDQLGIHIVGVPDPASQTTVTTVSLPGTPQGAGRYASSDWWFETPKPADDGIPVDVAMSACAGRHGCKGSFVIDLGALGVPADFWR